MRYLILILLIISCTGLSAQEDSLPPTPVADSLRAAPEKLLPKKRRDTVAAREISIKDYKIISYARDTTYLDTTLTINKEYKYNYLRRDDFELMPFANVGQPYNALGRDFIGVERYPGMGASTKHFNYMEIDDINYYHVPTPMTELFFKTTFEQGQLLDALLTLNTSPRFNVSIAYKGFRSLGKYQLNQAESGNFRTTASYISKNGRYWLRGHIAAQDIETEENGGLLNAELQFESQDPEFTDRSRIDVVLTDADGKLVGKRYFLQHQYTLLGKASPLDPQRTTTLGLRHQFAYETKYYQFLQTSQNDYFGEVFLDPINDKTYYKTMFNRVGAVFTNPVLGSLEGYSGVYNYNYYFNNLLITEEGQVDNQLKGEEISLGAAYQKNIGGFDLDADFAYTVSGELTDYQFSGQAGYNFNEQTGLKATLTSSSRMPDLNFLLYQSDYQNYNWQNTTVFDTQKLNSLRVEFSSSWFGELSGEITNIDNYTYFASTATAEQIAEGQENAFVKPFQAPDAVNYLKLGIRKEFRLGKWALNNTVMYQNVSNGGEYLNVPELVTRNSLYFSSHIFQKAMFLQTGVTFKYFTPYYMNAYNPLLSEFYIQDREELGGYPLLDFFINAKVRQTRIYLKAEHFNSSFGESNFYSAPAYPYRDFVIRFGLVWNFFS
ncbi:putative porin [Zeaxanthinibacter sp. PT1]|uniref:putative porin n=1 Tax=Zeaxanthinibacter TaxID=561554 RepID=UPI00234AA047|nr:putative porin [Zeaxanthinibacter sp. PT1]MDC6351303.1 putative porin [Zeaxanthinibacter sp. PT1]